MLLRLNLLLASRTLSGERLLLLLPSSSSSSSPSGMGINALVLSFFSFPPAHPPTPYTVSHSLNSHRPNPSDDDDGSNGGAGKQGHGGGRFRVVLLTKRLEAQHWEALQTIWRERGACVHGEG